jgi:hypothetical protein
MSIFGALKEKITRYIDVHIKLIRISFIERTSALLSYMIYALILLFIFFCIILFLGFGLTEVFVSAGLSKAVSFFITIGVYVILFIIAIMLRKKITRFFANEVVNVITEDDNENMPQE